MKIQTDRMIRDGVNCLVLKYCEFMSSGRCHNEQEVSM